MRPRIGITSTPTLYMERQVERVSRWYVDSVIGAGGLPLILPTMAPDAAREVLDGLDGLLLTGGGDVSPARYHQDPAPEVYDVDPARDEWELALVAAAAGRRPRDWAGCELPILGVCRGAQLLNVAAGGSLVQHLDHSAGHRLRDRDREAVHDVEVDPSSRLAGILGRDQACVGVNSVHHQAVDEVGEGFRPVAWATDGVIEAIERTDGAPIVAVQWHPESLTAMEPHARLFLWLTRAAAARSHGSRQLPESFQPVVPTTAGRGHLVDDVA